MDEVLALHEQPDTFTLLLPYSVKAEIEHPSTPAEKKRKAIGFLYSMEVTLTPPELATHEKLRMLIQGNAKRGRHERDAFQLVTTESTGKQHGEQGPIPFTLQPLTLRGLPKRLPLFSRQPVADPHAQFLGTLDAPYSGRQIRAQQSAIRRLICKTSDCSKAEIYCAWCKVTRLQMYTVANELSSCC